MTEDIHSGVPPLGGEKVSADSWSNDRYHLQTVQKAGLVPTKKTYLSSEEVCKKVLLSACVPKG